jgi:hypothetical protein
MSHNSPEARQGRSEESILFSEELVLVRFLQIAMEHTHTVAQPQGPVWLALQGSDVMHSKLLSLIMLVLGAIALYVPTVWPSPIHEVWPSRTAFVPYIILLISALAVRGKADRRLVCSFTFLVVVCGTWVYWDGMVFNRVFSWQISGLIYYFVPLFQTAISLSVLCFVFWRNFCVREGGGSVGNKKAPE